MQRIPVMSCIFGTSFTSKGEVMSRKIGVKEMKGIASDMSEACRARMNWNKASTFNVPPRKRAGRYCGPSVGMEPVNIRMASKKGMGVADAASEASCGETVRNPRLLQRSLNDSLKAASRAK